MNSSTVIGLVLAGGAAWWLFGRDTSSAPATDTAVPGTTNTTTSTGNTVVQSQGAPAGQQTPPANNQTQTAAPTQNALQSAANKASQDAASKVLAAGGSAADAAAAASRAAIEAIAAAAAATKTQAGSFAEWLSKNVGNVGTMSADSFNYYYSKFSGVQQTTDLFNPANRGELITADTYMQRRLAAGLSGLPTVARRAAGNYMSGARRPSSLRIRQLV